jgi:hypothetical protein
LINTAFSAALKTFKAQAGLTADLSLAEKNQLAISEFKLDDTKRRWALTLGGSLRYWLCSPPINAKPLPSSFTRRAN